MSSAPTRERTLGAIEAELAEARVAVAAAEEAEKRAFERVSRARKAHALQQIARKALLAVQGDLAAAQEATEKAKAKVRALDRLGVQEREPRLRDRGEFIK